jgi:hypothetical protein
MNAVGTKEAEQAGRTLLWVAAALGEVPGLSARRVRRALAPVVTVLVTSTPAAADAFVLLDAANDLLAKGEFALRMELAGNLVALARVARGLPGREEAFALVKALARATMANPDAAAAADRLLAALTPARPET